MPDGLELESRRRIYDFLTANPGVHLRKIGQVLGMSTGMLSYHLGYLERNGILKSEEDGHRKRYFIARAFVEAQRRILAVLRQDVPRKIVLELLFFGERTFGELQASVGVSKSTLSYHLQKLMHREVLLRGRRERESVFSIKDLEEVRKLLLANQSSFQDDAVDRFADLWTKIRT
ncbi:MAG: winged helix-turn-helix transcriptional regulator [Methanobacteriota archaeon]|nr:MAG: winged helix-turn-helix transcriptional regulator [Euryarchaeota archaeon]TLZ66323.1 MAG: winged helix-turn-helix transcriptional regulator [Euryarchaeota archaeon]